MKDAIVINGKTFLPGKSGTAILNTYRLPTRSVIEIPVYVFRSKNPGPTLLLLAGMHGDEINGIEIIRKLINREEVRNPICGSIIAIPVINIVSFLFGSRNLPDGRDLNRCFPGSSKGSLGARIAYDLMKAILPQVDMGIDFHTGGDRISNYPQVRCVFENETNVELARQFAAPFVIDALFRDSTFRKEAAKKGKSILVYEGGESSRFDYLAINEGINGVLRLMYHQGMTQLQLPSNTPVFLDDSSWIRAKHSGLFHTSQNNGAFINKGNVIGMISDPYGEFEYKIISPVDGYIFGLNNKPVVNQGDALMNIGLA